MKRVILLSIISLVLTIFALFGTKASPVMAQQSKLGIHIMQPGELDEVAKLFQINSQGDELDSWHYVTIPFTLDELGQESKWQRFFDQARKLKIIPIVRLTTRFKDGSWQVPTKKDVVDQINFLSQLAWPTNQRYIIAYNEPNHAGEWGGRIDPAQYAGVLEFVADWAHTENKNFIVLPAALDQAAPNGKATMEGFHFLEKMIQANKEVLSKIDVWNAHAYPNPGFVASPYSNSKMSLRSFQYELDWLKQKTGKDYLVMITETGWRQLPSNRWRLVAYYSYALKNIWSDHRVLAVTPFTLKGSPGPFSQFSFLDALDKPTAQYHAFKQALAKVGNLLQVSDGGRSRLDS